MIIKVDIREHDILTHINQLILFTPYFKQIKVITEALPIGDFIIADEKEEKLVIERKTINDLLASIKDGRYDEQSYRLNGLSHHNHNIIYLIEGDVNRVNRFKDNKTEKQTAYSAMFSLNYFKGFSVFRSFSMEETALLICNMAYKLEKSLQAGKKPFYQNMVQEKIICVPKVNQDGGDGIDKQEETQEKQEETQEKQEDIQEKQEETQEQSDKDYVNVIKKVKKENITPDNIGEIILCQIPGISSVTALAIMKKFDSISHLIKEVEQNENCLKDIDYINTKGQTRKINKTSTANILKYLLKK